MAIWSGPPSNFRGVSFFVDMPPPPPPCQPTKLTPRNKRWWRRFDLKYQRYPRMHQQKSRFFAVRKDTQAENPSFRVFSVYAESEISPNNFFFAKP